MKHLTLLLACSLTLCLSASAQFTPQQYPFPYNPDSNQDGMVSMTDFLEILGVFGQEYPDSFFSDSTIAILNLGDMHYHKCAALAKSAGQEWRVMNTKDVYGATPLLVESWNLQSTFWLWSNLYEVPTRGYAYAYSSNEDCMLNTGYNCIPNPDSSLFFRVDFSMSSGITAQYLHAERECILVTEVRPTILYTSAVTNWVVEDLLNDGWQPLGNLDGFWKEAE